jgi:hypothetical protein
VVLAVRPRLAAHGLVLGGMRDVPRGAVYVAAVEEGRLIAEPEVERVVVPEWIMRLSKRLLSLPSGRYIITLTATKERHDWTIANAGRIEN